MRINDNENWERIIIILCALSIILAAHNLQNKSKEEYASIPDDIIDYNYEGPSKQSLFIDKYITLEEREYINNYHKFPENFANIINTRIEEENQMLIRKKF